MIKKLTHVTILVRDLDESLRWYTEKLGFEKRSDEIFGPGVRWLTIGLPAQPQLEFVLQKPEPAFHGEELAGALTNRIGQGTTWVLETDDCRKTYAELVARGVKFAGPPEEIAWGVSTVFEDLYGNPFNLVEPR